MCVLLKISFATMIPIVFKLGQQKTE